VVPDDPLMVNLKIAINAGIKILREALLQVVSENRSSHQSFSLLVS
jgi:hypothetical protein